MASAVGIFVFRTHKILNLNFLLICSNNPQILFFFSERFSNLAPNIQKTEKQKTMKRITVFIMLSVICIQITAQNSPKDSGAINAKNLFEQFEISASEGFNLLASEKIGSKKLYGIVAIGTQCFSEDYKWGFGIGAGTQLFEKKDFSSNFEFVTYHINENEIWTDSYNGLQQLKLSFSKDLSNRFSVFVGPSFNLLVTRNKTEYGTPFDSTFAPYEIFKNTGDKSTLRGWIGLTAGLRIN